MNNLFITIMLLIVLIALIYLSSKVIKYLSSLYSSANTFAVKVSTQNIKNPPNYKRNTSYEDETSRYRNIFQNIKDVVFGFFLILMIFIVGIQFYKNLNPEIDGLVYQDEDVHLNKYEKSKIENNNVKFLCALRDVCQKYSKAQYECAMAGNINKCVEIRIGNKNYEYIDMCNDDGSINLNVTKIPSRLECLIKMY